MICVVCQVCRSCWCDLLHIIFPYPLLCTLFLRVVKNFPWCTVVQFSLLISLLCRARPSGEALSIKRCITRGQCFLILLLDTVDADSCTLLFIGGALKVCQGREDGSQVCHSLFTSLPLPWILGCIGLFTICKIASYNRLSAWTNLFSLYCSRWLIFACPYYKRPQ